MTARKKCENKKKIELIRMHGKKKFTERGRFTHISRAKVVAGCEGCGQYALCVHNAYLFLHTLLTPTYTHTQSIFYKI